MDPTDEGCFAISAQSDLAKLIKRAVILMVDESTLVDRRNFDKMAATLNDITGCDLPWGGKIVIFSGDFRLLNFSSIEFIANIPQAMPPDHPPSKPSHNCRPHHQQIQPVERSEYPETDEEHEGDGPLRGHGAGRLRQLVSDSWRRCTASDWRTLRGADQIAGREVL